jgi:exopolysaccharide production protein ExoQ
LKVKLSEKLLTILLIFISVGTLSIRPAQEISLSPLGGSRVDTLLNLTAYAILFYFLILYWKGFLYVVTKSKLQFLLLAIILFSLLWSQDLGNSLTYLRGLIRIYLLAIYLAMRYSLTEQMRLIAWGLGSAASLSIFFSAVMPDYVHTAPELAGMWSGIFGHKNELGYMMAWSAGVFLHLGLSVDRYRWLMWLLCGVSICLIILSRSTTSLMILLTMVLLLPCYKLIKQNNYKLRVIMIGIVVMLLIISSIFITNNAESLIGTSGKDLTFSGRSDLWEKVISKILERPWLGYGFYGFWTSADASNLRDTVNWASNAHNGFLELLLELGVLGFLTFAAGFLRFFVMAVTRVVLVSKKPEDYWPMQILLIIVIVNFSEARLLTPSWNWLMYITTSLSMSCDYKRKLKTIALHKLSLPSKFINQEVSRSEDFAS